MRFYLDTMIWIYALEGNAQFGAAAQGLMRNIRAANHVLLTSHFLLGELLVAPTKRGDTFTAEFYRHVHASPAIEMIPFTTGVADHFAQFRAHSQTKAPDALHLALAAGGQADVFVTGDAALKRVAMPGHCKVVDLSYPLP